MFHEISFLQYLDRFWLFLLLLLQPIDWEYHRLLSVWIDLLIIRVILIEFIFCGWLFRNFLSLLGYCYLALFLHLATFLQHFFIFNGLLQIVNIVFRVSFSEVYQSLIFVLKIRIPLKLSLLNFIHDLGVTQDSWWNHLNLWTVCVVLQHLD